MYFCPGHRSSLVLTLDQKLVFLAQFQLAECLLVVHAVKQRGLKTIQSSCTERGQCQFRNFSASAGRDVVCTRWLAEQLWVLQTDIQRELVTCTPRCGQKLGVF